VASAPLSPARERLGLVNTFVRTKAAVNAPHSRRSARCEHVWQSRSVWSAVASAPLSPAREGLELVKTFVRTKAAWRFASRRSPKYLVEVRHAVASSHEHSRRNC
jgi:hypothetical protein